MNDKQYIQFYSVNILAAQKFARRFTTNTNDIEDLIQEASLKAYRNRHTFRPGSNFKSWFFTILRNTFITGYHKKRRRGLLSAPIEDLGSVIPANTNSENGAISNLSSTEIKGCIKELKTKFKRPFDLHIQGYKYNEIAKTLNIPTGTVKSRINTARTKLKHKLMQRGVLAA